jgi:hypothetical protein
VHTLLNIVLLIVIAAMVAMFGDRMGRVAAKRKVAIFGLRPRLAAAWIAVLTGVCIALATVAFITLVSRDAREMLFHFDELKQNLMQLETEVNDLEYNRSMLAKDKQELEQHLDKTRKELEVKEDEASLLELKIEESNRRYDDIRVRLERAELELTEGEKRLTELRAELAEEEATNQRLQEEQTLLQEQIGTLKTVKSGMASEARALEERIVALREGNIAIEVNQPLAYIPLPGGMTLPESQKRILTALNDLRLQLEADGITMKPVPSSALNEILNTLSLLTEDTILVVYSATNVLSDEEAKVTFKIVLDRVVFRKGELISRINIDADVGRDQLPELFAYAFAAVRAVALSRGMLPDIVTGDVGSISASDVAKAAEKIEAVEGKRILEIRAGRDFRTTDTLDSFEFEVRRG